MRAHVLEVRGFANFISKRERASMDKRLNAELLYQSLRYEFFRGLYAAHNSATVG